MAVAVGCNGIALLKLQILITATANVMQDNVRILQERDAVMSGKLAGNKPLTGSGKLPAVQNMKQEGIQVRKMTVCMLLALCMLFLVQIPAMAAPGPDGFANVPWGASRDRVDSAMKAQGFVYGGQNVKDGIDNVWYRGQIAGISGDITMSLLNGAFYEGQFLLLTQDGLSGTWNAFRTFNNIIEQKYGAPSSQGVEDDNKYRWHVWQFLHPPNSSDNIKISLYSTNFGKQKMNNGSIIISHCTLNYSNLSLEKRLAVQKRDGL